MQYRFSPKLLAAFEAGIPGSFDDLVGIGPMWLTMDASLPDNLSASQSESDIAVHATNAVVSLAPFRLAKEHLMARRKLAEDREQQEDDAMQLQVKAALKQAREVRGLKQWEMADYLDTSVANYEKYESTARDKNGKLRGVPLRTIVRFCRMVNTTVDDLLKPKKHVSNG